MSYPMKVAERPPDPERVRSALSAIPAHDRETWLRMGMAVKAGLGEHGFNLWNEWSQGAENYKDKNTRDVWKGIKPEGGITLGTLFYVAKENSWQDDGAHTGNKKGAENAPQASRPIATLDDGEDAKKTAKRPPAEVLELFESYGPATGDHPYIQKKKGTPEGLRVVQNKQPHAGSLAVPVYNIEGAIQSIQYIDSDGGKKNLPNAPKAGGRFTVGELDRSGRVYIVEGIGHAWSCYQATGAASVCTFGAGNMQKVAASLREKYPQAELVLVPDVGEEDKARELAKDLACWLATMPEGEPHNFDANDLALREGFDKLRELLDTASKPEAEAPFYKLLSGDDLDAMPPLRWRIKGVLPQTGYAAIYGPSGSGKSFLALDAACAIAIGGEWFGHRVTACPVVYVALEGQAGFSQRTQAWQFHHQSQSPTYLHFVTQPFDLTNARHVEDLALVTPPGAVVIVDTLNRSTPTADENSSRDMGTIIEGMTTLQDKIKGLVVLVTHTGKDASRGLRGHSSLVAALDAAIEVSKADRGLRTWSTAKVKDGRDDTAHQFDLVEYDLGEDDDGERLTSCAISDEGIAPRQEAKQPRTSANEKLARDSYWEAAEIRGRLDADLKFAGLHLDDWRPVFYSKSTADTQDAKRKAFERIRKDLTSKGLATVKDDVYRLLGPEVGLFETEAAKGLLKSQRAPEDEPTQEVVDG